jgi:hypothetical protein
MAYGYIGSMQTTPGHRDDVVSILPSGVDNLRKVGCDLLHRERVGCRRRHDLGQRGLAEQGTPRRFACAIRGQGRHQQDNADAHGGVHQPRTVRRGRLGPLVRGAADREGSPGSSGGCNTPDDLRNVDLDVRYC